MPQKKVSSVVFIFIIAIITVAVLFVIFPPSETEKVSDSQSNVTPTSPEPTDIWFGLQERTPYPHTTPLPAAVRSPLDGTYAKIDESLPQWWTCRRCADYRPAGGIWKIRFNQGIMRIYYNVTGWNSIASYTVSGDHLYLFNDPYCPEEVGEYKWSLDEKWGLDNRVLTLEVVSDSCSIELRGQNLSAQEWGACYPPNEMTGASDHWHKPDGCEEPNPALFDAPDLSDLPVYVTVYPGYAKNFFKEPEIYANANSEEISPLEDIVVKHNEDSIPYGSNRVLWGEGSWVEVATEIPLDAIGVQIYGDSTIGWARILFDGQEVWRGNTVEIWMDKGYYGGYIEVSGFEPGGHILRVESLGFDYHPVTVAFFGFSERGGVEMGEP